MKLLNTLFIAVSALSLSAQGVPNPDAALPQSPLLQVHRIFVAPLSGGKTAEALRDLIISGINTMGAFVLTDNPERADAILKGAADDRTFDDTFNSTSSVSARENGGRSSGLLSNKVYGGGSASEIESHHIRERKHEAYASVRLCSLNGDVLWSTTQESQGAKFHGASADVADKVARQLALDVERAKRTMASNSPAAK